MLDAVISPLKRERPLTSADALDWLTAPASAETLAFAEPAVTIDAPVVGSVPYAKPPLNWTWSPGALIAGVAPPAWPGTLTLIACALAVASAACARCSAAPAAAVVRREATRSRAIGVRVSTTPHYASSSGLPAERLRGQHPGEDLFLVPTEAARIDPQRVRDPAGNGQSRVSAPTARVAVARDQGIRPEHL